jgi:VWFA-related protein
MTSKQARTSIVLALVGSLVSLTPSRPAAQQQEKAPVFRTNLSIVSVDVVVRDRDGKVVRGLTEADFDLLEDGRSQDVRTFAFEEITDAPSRAVSVNLLAGVEERALTSTSGAAPAPAAAATAAPVPMRSEDLAGRRLVILLFDTSSMQPEDVQRSVDSARKYVAEQMSTSDLVAVATVSSVLDVLTDFTADRDKVSAALNQ